MVDRTKACRNSPAVFAADHTCAAIIPCRNEAGRIGEVVRGVRRYLSTVIVVDDASEDETGPEARRAQAVVLRHATCDGKGAAFITAWQEAKQRGFQWVLHMDGDGQHAPADVPRFLEASTGRASLVIGNRFENPNAIPWKRRVVNRWMSRRLSLLTGATFPDSQCGFRLVHLQTVLSLPIRTRHFEIESELCVAFARAGKEIQFIPVEARYGDEVSKISPIQDAFRWWKWYAAECKHPPRFTS